MLDDVLKQVSDELPEFNHFLIKTYRERQIDACMDFMKMTFKEAARLFNGKVEFKGARVLSPEERIQTTLNNTRYSPTVDIATSELMLVEFEFAYEGSTFKIPLYLPYLKDDAIIINGAKYYVQFALTDRVFYHIQKENGLGIKVLRAHLRFWRNLRHQFVSLSGQRYGEQVIVVKIHLRNHKYTAEDLRTALLLYPLSVFGWNITLERYGIDPNKVQLCEFWNREDVDNEYFQIRKASEKPGLYLKVAKELLENKSDIVTRTSLRVVASLHYLLQYFVRCKNTMYVDNKDLIERLTSKTDFTVWQIILGATIFGINYGETRVFQQSEQHLESLKTYLDPHTKMKLADEDIHVNDVMDLLDYVFMNMDAHVVNYTPSDLSQKRANVIDLLFGAVVQRVFVKVYQYTNSHRKSRASSIKEIESLFKIPIRSFTQIHNCGALVAINPATYNDNYLLTVGCRKMRATHSASGSGESGKSAGGNKGNHLTSPEHRFHPSWMVVESITSVSHTNPDIAGDINVLSCDIDEKGNIVISEAAEEFIQQMLPLVITK